MTYLIFVAVGFLSFPVFFIAVALVRDSVITMTFGRAPVRAKRE